MRKRFILVALAVIGVNLALMGGAAAAPSTRTVFQLGTLCQAPNAQTDSAALGGTLSMLRFRKADGTIVNMTAGMPAASLVYASERWTLYQACIDIP